MSRKALPKIRLRFLVSAVDVAALESTSHQRSIRIANDCVDSRANIRHSPFFHCFPSPDRSVHARTRLRLGDQRSVTHNQVRSHDDAHIVELKALARVNASDLIDRILGDYPQAVIAT
jgi:hypothetical protein